MKTSTFYFFLFALFFVSCSNPKDLIYQDVTNFKLLELSLNPRVGMDVQFYNPNKKGMVLKDANIDVYINNKLIGNAKMEQRFTVPAMDTFLLPVTLKADLKGVFANTISIVANKEVKLKLHGWVKAGRKMTLPVPINYEGTKRLNVLDFN
jgi:LEA14-like dessication related protein